jgi:hypothetical protein
VQNTQKAIVQERNLYTYELESSRFLKELISPKRLINDTLYESGTGPCPDSDKSGPHFPTPIFKIISILLPPDTIKFSECSMCSFLFSFSYWHPLCMSLSSLSLSLSLSLAKLRYSSTCSSLNSPSFPLTYLLTYSMEQSPS